jgi:hypothetical protein
MTAMAVMTTNPISLPSLSNQAQQQLPGVSSTNIPLASERVTYWEYLQSKGQAEEVASEMGAWAIAGFLLIVLPVLVMLVLGKFNGWKIR